MSKSSKIKIQHSTANCNFDKFCGVFFAESSVFSVRAKTPGAAEIALRDRLKHERRKLFK